jgi:hypothetical protein
MTLQLVYSNPDPIQYATIRLSAHASVQGPVIERKKDGQVIIVVMGRPYIGFPIVSRPRLSVV